ncbi:hypothetical protein CLU79DRAFT_714314 [Phycomyces nitens]|nr:hypothetical protein CLU79DRAFT_714314 [Phycomyces nitens]
MSSASSIYNVKCYCTVCGDNEEGYTFVTRRTAQHHNKRARVEEAFRTSRGILFKTTVVYFNTNII